MIVNSNGERVSAKIKAKLVLTDYVKLLISNLPQIMKSSQTKNLSVFRNR
jgi:hypothetical protein